MYASSHDHYRTQAATTASPAQLVLMLFDGALAEVARADRALQASPVEVEEVHDCLSRAQAIVTELSLTLDHDRGGEVAANLGSLYTFCLERLIEANVRKSGEVLGDVRDVVAGLRDSWETACVQSSVAAAV